MIAVLLTSLQMSSSSVLYISGTSKTAGNEEDERRISFLQDYPSLPKMRGVSALSTRVPPPQP